MNGIPANNAILILPLLFLSLCVQCSDQEAPVEPHTKEVIQSILDTRVALEKSHCPEGCIFLTFWDFDGTILRGDCSEGLRKEDRLIYRGLVELTIEEGFSSRYRRNEAGKFEKEYRRRDRELGHKNSYTYLATQYAGANPEEIQKFAELRFEELYRHHYYGSSMEIWNALHEEGIQNHVISASPHVFVLGAANSLSVPEDRINGIRLQIQNDRLLPLVDPPLTYAEGKTATLQQVVRRIEKENPDKNVFILAAFGNSYHTDGDFLRHVEDLDLPSGKTVSVMINGGEPPEEYNGRFMRVNQSYTVPSPE